jgi:phage terminase large subunit-like protein
MTTKDLFADLQNPPPEKQIILARAGLDCKTIKRAAVIVDDSGNWLKPIWDKRYTLEELRAIQISMSNLRFERELMCNPLGSGANIFRNIKLGSEESDKPFLDEDYYMGVDIAMQGGKKSDWFVISILGKNKKTNLVKQRKLERYQNYGPEQITKRIEELAEKFEVKKVILEKIGLGIGIIKELANKQKYPNTSRALEPFHTGKVGKEELVSSIMVGFDTNVLEILDNTIQYNELITFQAKEDTRSGKITYESVGEHDDCVCALGLAMNSILSEEKGGVSVDIVDFF